MKLRRLKVTHFGCVESATVELGPGLNVLYGPNDLGKSTLARAIRAALLIQHSSSAANEYAPWHSGEAPLVEVELELPDRRFWRLEKRFATSGGASVLRESTDGNTFSPLKKGREVDDEVREKLSWGIAGPATKGAPRGLPNSFLASVILGEQTDVAGVLQATLDADTSESGRERLTAALAAFAQDPLFKSVLEQSQEKVDEAFTAKGRRKTGKTSPFKEATEEVKRVKDLLDQISQRVDESENAERALAAKNDEFLRKGAVVDEQRQGLESLKGLLDQSAKRRAAEAALEAAQADHQAKQRKADELADAKVRLGALMAEAGELEAQVTAAHEVVSAKAAALEAAKRTLAEAKSADAQQARELRKAELERNIATLDNNRQELEGKLTAATKAKDLAATRASVFQEQETLRSSVAAKAQALEQAKATLSAIEAEERLLSAASRKLELIETEERLEELARAKADADADRAKAEEHLAAVRELTNQLLHDVPNADAVKALKDLERKLEVAEAKLDAGLGIAIERLGDVAITATADGKPADVSAVPKATLDAKGRATVTIGDLARVTITAGAAELRAEADALSERRLQEVVPVLAQHQVGSLDELEALVAKNESTRAAIAEAQSNANRLRELAEGKASQLARIPDLERERDALERELESAPTEEVDALLEKLGPKKPSERRSELTAQRTAAEATKADAETAVREAETKEAVLKERLEATDRELASLSLPEPDRGWLAFIGELEAKKTAIATQKTQIEVELASLVEAQSSEIAAAEAAVASAQEALAQADTSAKERAQALSASRDRLNQLSGEVKAMEASVAELDLDGAKAHVDAMATALAATPAPPRIVTQDDIARSEEDLNRAQRELELLRDEVRKAEGALQTVGGQVVKEQQQTAEEALRIAELKEHDIELEYDAWKLLVEKLREAENTEGQHLGEALSQPVTDHFSKLTNGRYGKLELGPDLSAGGLQVDGVSRELSSLSVGTQEQLATLLRLTVAEQLGTMLILDDHLTQTDPERTSWFRDMFRDHAARSQIVVMTCRPLDYLLAEDMPEDGEASASRAAGLVRATDLGKIIKRSQPAGADRPSVRT